MIISNNVFDENLSKELKNVAKLICNRMNVNSYYKSKLEKTSVNVTEIVNLNTKGKMSISATFGSSDKFSGYIINLDVNSSDPIEWIRLVFGHELSHLLIARNSLVVSSGYVQTDKSIQYTVMQRKYESKNGTVVYGSQMEEALCWMIAYDTLKDINSKKKYCGDIYDSFKEGVDSGYLDVIRKVISVFNNVPDIDISTVKFDESSFMVPHNYFYSCLSEQNLSYVIYCFDSELGKGSWKKLSMLVDKYYLDFEEEYEEKIYQMLNKYKIRKEKQKVKFLLV